MVKIKGINYRKLTPRNYFAVNSKVGQKWFIPSKIWFLTLFILTLVIVAQLIASNFLAGKGEQLMVLEIRSSQLVRENQVLLEELSLKSSLAKLSIQAQNEGFAKADKILYLDTSFPVASLE